MEHWSKMMTEFVSTDAYAEANAEDAQRLAPQFLAVSQIDRDGGESIASAMNMRLRDDYTGLAERLTNIEMRLDDVDAKLDAGGAQRGPDTKAESWCRAITKRRQTRRTARQAKQLPRTMPMFSQSPRWPRKWRRLIGCSRPMPKSLKRRKRWFGRSIRPSCTTTFRSCRKKSDTKFRCSWCSPIMNRPHVLDLRPGHSFVEYMRDRGYDIYLLDWGIPGPEDKELEV